jgi:hypothetical protein
MLRSAGAFSDARSAPQVGHGGAACDQNVINDADDPNALDLDEEDPQFNLTLRGAAPRPPVADHVTSKERTSAVTDGLSVLRGRVGSTVPVVDADVTLLRLDVTA